MTTSFEQDQALKIANEIMVQPTAWKHIVKIIREQKEDLKEFMDPLLKKEDLDLLLIGTQDQGFIASALFPYIDHLHNIRPKALMNVSPNTQLDPNKTTLLICFDTEKNDRIEEAMKEADEICKGNVHYLCIVSNRENALYQAAIKRDNAYVVVLEKTADFTDQMVATLLCFSLDHFIDASLKLEDVARRSLHFLNHTSQEIIDLVRTYAFDHIVYVGMDTFRGIGAEKDDQISEEVAGTLSISEQHKKKTLYVIFMTYDHAKDQKILLECVKQLKGHHVLAVCAKHDEGIKENVKYYVDLGLAHTKNNVFLPFAYLIVAQTLALFKAIVLDSQQELSLLTETIRVCTLEYPTIKKVEYE